MTPTKYGVRGIPTLMLFKNGEISRHQGGRAAQEQAVRVGRGVALGCAPAPDVMPRRRGCLAGGTDMTEAMRAARSAWQAFLERFPATATVDLILPDLVGIARGKRLTAEAFAGGLEGGLSFPGSLYGIDSTGANVDASGLIWEEGDPDRPCLVDPTTFAPVPWRAGGAQVLARAGRCLTARPFFADPRALAAAASRPASRTIGLHAGRARSSSSSICSISARAAMAGRARCAPGRRPRGAPRRSSTASIRSTSTSASSPAWRATAQARGCRPRVRCRSTRPASTRSISAMSPIRCAPPITPSCSNAPIKAAARADGLQATFMAKPFADRAASGLHVHVSLSRRATGDNRFARDPARSTTRSAGCRRPWRRAMLLFAPNANSYRRLRPLCYAPIAPTWGHDNRTVALRVPSGAAAARRIEHRVAGADANPYLVLAAVLAGIHHGLDQRLEPGAPDRQRLCRGPAEPAAELGIGDRGAGGGHGAARAISVDDFCRLYRVCRAAERDRFDDLITPTEYAWYFGSGLRTPAPVLTGPRPGARARAAIWTRSADRTATPRRRPPPPRHRRPTRAPAGRAPSRHSRARTGCAPGLCP